MNPTPAEIKEDIQKMLEDKILTLGEPCAPYNLNDVLTIWVSTKLIVWVEPGPKASLHI